MLASSNDPCVLALLINVHINDANAAVPLEDCLYIANFVYCIIMHYYAEIIKLFMYKKILFSYTEVYNCN